MRQSRGGGGSLKGLVLLAALFGATVGGLMIESAHAGGQGELIYYVFPSPKGIDWSSPRRLTWSSIINILRFKFEREHNIGHVNIEVRCSFGDGREESFLTGMTSGKKGETTKAVLWDQMGLGSLFYNFVGRLESREEVQRQWPERKKHGELAVIRYAISESTCERLLRFEREYRESGAQVNYGLPRRPRHGEGGGCSAYGVSYLELAGVLTDEMREHWSRTVLVPEDLIGEPEKNKHVSIGTLLLSFWRKWARPDHPHRPIFFWDPDAMYRWIVAVHASNRSDFGRQQVGAVPVLTQDATSVPTPDEPIWLN
jgi:hypothetical protein